jgi:heat shock protein HslJ
MRWSSLFAALILVVGLLACESIGSNGNGVRQIVGPTWQLESLRTADGDSIPRGALIAGDETGERFTLEFREDGEFDGTADCNVYGGFASQNGSRLSLDSLLVTNELCGEQSREEQYLTRLPDVDGYEVRSDRLRLTRRGDPILRFNQIE